MLPLWMRVRLKPLATVTPGPAEFDELILYLREHLKLTVVMVSHDMDSLLRICDRLAVILDKKILVDCKEVVMRHPHPWIRQYFGGPRGRAAQGIA